MSEGVVLCQGCEQYLELETPDRPKPWARPLGGARAGPGRLLGVCAGGGRRERKLTVGAECVLVGTSPLVDAWGCFTSPTRHLVR